MGMPVKMLSIAVLSFAFAAALGQDDGIRCGECMMEMHRFGGIIHASGDVLGKYLADNYCPTIEEEHQEGCLDHLAQHYPDMLGAVVHRFISSDEGARHMCTTMGACHPKQRAFTCDECVLGWSGLRPTWRIQSSRRRPCFSSNTTGQPRASRRPLHRDPPAPLHPHARHGDGQVHDPA